MNGMDEEQQPAPPLLTPDDVARYPLPGMAIPSDLAFSADDRCVTYLWSAEGNLTKQLYALDLASGEQRLLLAAQGGGTTDQNVTPEEALRRERQRQRAHGVTQYTWAAHADRLIVPLPDGLYLLDGLDAVPRLLVGGSGGPIIDPQPSPDGRLVAFVRDDELYVVPATGGPPYQVTQGARGQGKAHGLAEYIAQEEMGRLHGHWWSDDGAMLAFTEVDESEIPLYRIVHQGKDGVGEGAQEDHRYPFAGGANARVRLGVVGAGGGDPVWLDHTCWPHEYLARVDWSPNGALYVQVQNREQNELALLRYDVASGTGRVLLIERSDIWINLHDMFRPLQDGGFLWASERSGFQHLYRYDDSGQQGQALTAGAWMVEAVIHVDEQQRLVFFTATRDSVLERHLHTVSLDAEGETAPRRLTSGAGMHAVVADHSGKQFIEVYQTLTTPPIVMLRSLADGSALRTVFDRPDPRVAQLSLQPPDLVTVLSRDGVALHGALYRPPSSFGPGPFPTIVSVYGGPHAQMVSRSWTMMVQMRAQYLRSLGFLVFTLDNRGSARRGLAFEGAIKRHLGNVEVDDQVDGVRWLVHAGFADPQRVGIYGWSYGGYMAALCLLKAPETFQAAVAGAPVTSWDGYDTHYTERYMGTPQSNPAGYAGSSVLQHVAGLRGHLMLVHGLVDENVHFRHTARLINALIAARKPYDLLLFPNERHMPRAMADRVYTEERIAAFFRRRLIAGREE
ncbi:MAG: DPP IV N-terminal domain-containing protein [Chloroflexota bacterium]